MSKWIGTLLSITVGTMLFVGCSSEVSIQHDDPESVLRGYFELLIREEYEAVAELYGGDYELLEGYAGNSVDPDDRAGLFQSYIHITVGIVVRVNEIVEKKQVSPGTYEFKINFITPEGDLFRDGQVYTYRVEMINGQYKVMDIPPYVA